MIDFWTAVWGGIAAFALLALAASPFLNWLFGHGLVWIWQ